jgi:hypothetical protein
MEFSQMGSIKSFVSEHSVDGEVLHGLELLLLRKFVEHLRTDGSCVSSEQILFRLVNTPVIFITS